MSETDTTRDSALPEVSQADEPLRPALGDWAWRAFFALLVLLFGVFVGGIAPWFSLSCGTCQDGMRDARFITALTVVAWYVVPLVTVGTAAGLFLPRAGVRIGWTGTGLVAALLFVIMVLGRIPA
ncbi:hypothetical protein GTW43_09520 [Streptomyces sp. SID5785]|uniref:hypothetical protein n=1 Tax=Streptomyces sp. SID5785 TaxID=2690309 RepID=UPI001360FE52|nr:hypothetical protein [Streptomyces sp. SID5785]MZD05319.1 hypothetical protein [Streptomyces sp. SID5785]